MNTQPIETMTKRRRKLPWVVDVAILVILAALLFSPQGIVGRWIADIYEHWEERHRIAESWDDLSDANSRVGTASNQRTIVEFIDYECPACRSVAPAVSDAVSQGVTIVFRHFPLVQIHPGAREAALAAICAERYGVFGEIHDAMLTDDAWMGADHDWGDLAMRVGIVEDGGFEECMGDDETSQRLREDRELAESLGVQGTPSFVTRDGIFLGPEGWTQALATLPSSVRDVRASVPTFELSDDTVFDSAVHGNVAISSLAKLSNAMFLPGERLLIQDGVWFHFVDLQTGSVVTAGGRGGGPGEFETPFQTIRSANGVTVWDVVAGRLTNLSVAGEYINSRRFDVGELRSPMAPLVAAFQDSSVVFRDDSTAAMGGVWPNGLHREPARYVRFTQEGRGLVHIGSGAEVVYREPMSAPVLFGHHILESSLGDSLVIAQTDLPTIRVYDGSGNLASQIRMPGPIDVSTSQVERARKTAIEEEQNRISRLSRRLGYHLRDDLLSYDLPANDPAPPIDGMFADLDRRIWLREYRLPGYSAIRWQAWKVDQPDVEAELWIRPGEGTLLDASGEKVLLHVRDAFDVDRILVRRIAPYRGAEQ